MDIRVPRFYIDAVSFRHAVGSLTVNPNYTDAYFFNLAKGYGKQIFSSNSYREWIGHVTTESTKLVPCINYFAVLGHKWNGNGDNVGFNLRLSYLNNDGTEVVGMHKYVDTDSPTLVTTNAELGYSDFNPEWSADKSGYTIVRTQNEIVDDMPVGFFNHIEQEKFINPADQYVYARRYSWIIRQMGGADNVTTRIGGLSFGWTYTMPHSPDMSLNYNIEYDYDTTVTKGGATLTNMSWFKPDYDGGRSNIWDLHTHQGHDLKESPSGRRTWNLSFSYLNRTDAHGTNISGNKDTFYGSEMMYLYGDPDGSGELTNQYVGIKHDFYTRCIHGTLGGALPFIFQPDSTIDDYAICRFDMNTFSFKQQAPDLFEISVKIVETW